MFIFVFHSYDCNWLYKCCILDSEFVSGMDCLNQNKVSYHGTLLWHKHLECAFSMAQSYEMMICCISNSVSGCPWFHSYILWHGYLLHIKILRLSLLCIFLNLNQCSYDGGLFSSGVCIVETTFNKDLGFRCYHVGADEHAAKLEHYKSVYCGIDF